MFSGSAGSPANLSPRRGRVGADVNCSGWGSGWAAVTVSLHYAPYRNDWTESVGYRGFRQSIRGRPGTKPARRPPHLPTQPRYAPEGARPGARRRHRQRHGAVAGADGDMAADPRRPRRALARGRRAPTGAACRELARVGGRVPEPAHDQRGVAPARRLAAPRRQSSKRSPAPSPRRGDRRRPRSREQLARPQLAPGRRPPRARQPAPSASRARTRTRQRGLDPHPLLRVQHLLGRRRRRVRSARSTSVQRPPARSRSARTNRCPPM